LQRILAIAFHNYDLDVRGLLYQSECTAPDHTRARRLTADALYRVIGLDREALGLRPPRARIVLFDDVLTTGKHYKCCERRLREALADTPISGLFVARRVLPRRWRCPPPPPPPQAGSARALAAP
jgi:predicted amidophosphoribosyltransferase